MAKQYLPQAGRVAATVLIVGFVALVVRGNWLVFQLTCEVAGVFVAGGVSLSLVAGVVRQCRRSLLMPPESLVAIAALLIALTWAVPTTPRTRFFADTRQIRVGMTVAQVRARLPHYRENCLASRSSLSTHLQAAEATDTSRVIGNLEYRPQHYTNGYNNDFSNFRIKSGKVVDVFHYVD